MSLVYFLRSGDGPIKIGWTSRPRTRLSSLVSQAPDAHVMGVIHGAGSREESALHERFAQHRLATCEWFVPDPEILEFCDELEPWDPETAPPSEPISRRRPKPRHMRRSHIVKVPLREDEKTEWDRTAESLGQDTAAWVRDVVGREIQKLNRTPRR